LSYASPSTARGSDGTMVSRPHQAGPHLAPRREQRSAPPSARTTGRQRDSTRANAGGAPQSLSAALYFGSYVRTFMIAERIWLSLRIPVLPQAGIEPLPLKITS